MSYEIRIVWDEDAAVWIASSPDLPGLILESCSFDALLERVRYAVPELIELNGQQSEIYNLTYTTEHHDQVKTI